MSLAGALDVVSGVLVVTGALFAVTAGVGLLRFGDLWLRMHAGTKPQVLGLLLVLSGTGIQLAGSGGAVTALLLVAVFQLATSPVSAHVLSRAGHRSGAVPRTNLVLDELAEASRDAAERPGDAADEAPGEPPGGGGDLPPR